MIVTTISRGYISSVSLPQKVAGQYRLYDEIQNVSERLVSIEGINNKWVLQSNRKVKILDSNGEVLKNTVLSPLRIYMLQKADIRRFVFTEPATEDRRIFTKYLIKEDIVLSIGRSKQNDICFDSGVVSAKHAALSFHDGRWCLRDEGSANGTVLRQRPDAGTILSDNRTEILIYIAANDDIAPTPVPTSAPTPKPTPALNPKLVPKHFIDKLNN